MTTSPALELERIRRALRAHPESDLPALAEWYVARVEFLEQGAHRDPPEGGLMAIALIVALVVGGLVGACAGGGVIWALLRAGGA